MYLPKLKYKGLMIYLAHNNSSQACVSDERLDPPPLFTPSVRCRQVSCTYTSIALPAVIN